MHNFGAAGVPGDALFALWPAPRLEYARVFDRLISALVFVIGHIVCGRNAVKL